MPLEPLLTADGSFTLSDTAAGVTYHSTAGAESESEHVFFQGTAFDALLSALPAVYVLEIGLGTGLNALLTAEKATRAGIQVHYTAYEPSPPPTTLLHELAGARFPSAWVDALYSQPEAPVALGALHLTWRNSPWPPADPPAAVFHAVFYDPFSPRHAPELWTETALLAAYYALLPNGKLATYSINGATKRLLRTKGIPFQRPRGFGPKREMLVLEKPAC